MVLSSSFAQTNNIPLNDILDPTGNLDMHNYVITNVGDATIDTDALNRQTADSRYY